MALLGRRDPRALRTPTMPAGSLGRGSIVLAGLALLVLALLLAGLPLLFAAALVVGLIVVTLTLIEPAFGLYAAILSVPVQDLVALPAGLTITQAVVVLAFSTWSLRVLAHPDRSLNLRLLTPWLLLLFVQLVSIMITPYSREQGLLQFARWVAAFLAFVLTLGTITDQRRAWGLVLTLLLGPALAALIGLYQFVVPSASPESFLILGGRFARASATFGKPNPFAGYLNMAWPLAVALSVFFLTRYWTKPERTESREPRAESRELRTETDGGRLAVVLSSLFLTIVCGGFALLLLAGLFASYSRGGWVGAVVGVGALAVVAGRRTALLAGGGALLLLLVGLLGAFSILPPVLTDRLTTITENLRIFDAGRVTITSDNFAIVERMAHWQAGWRMFNAWPLFGVGTGNFNSAYPDVFVAPWAISQGHAHNYYIHALAETGFFGLISYLVLIGAMARETLRARRVLRGTVWGAAAVGVCGIMAAVAGHNIFENLHVLNLGIQLSGVWGLSILAQRWGERSAA